MNIFNHKNIKKYPKDVSDYETELADQLFNETYCMARYSLGRGLSIPQHLLDVLYGIKHDNSLQPIASPLTDSETDVSENKDDLTESDIRALSQIHAQLTRLVSPATPRTIALLDYEKRNKGAFYFLGPVSLVRQLSYIAIFSLLSLVLIASSPFVNLEGMNQGFFASEGVSLLVNQTFLLCCAGLGAVFSGLFKASKYVTNGTYDPVYESSYWSSIILGLMAGIIIVELVPPELFSGSSASATQGGGDTLAVSNFGKPTLALVGGFSADLIYRLLNRIVDSIDHFVKGDRSATMTAETRASDLELSEKSLRMQSDHASQLLRLQRELESAKDVDSVKGQIMDFISESFPNEPGGRA